MNKIYIRLLKIIIKKFLLFLECRIIQSGPDTRMLDPFRSNNIRTYVQAFQIKYLSNGKISIFRIFSNLSTSIIGLTYNFVLQLETISNFKSWRGHQNLRFLSRSVIQMKYLASIMYVVRIQSILHIISKIFPFFGKERNVIRGAIKFRR